MKPFLLGLVAWITASCALIQPSPKPTPTPATPTSFTQARASCTAPQPDNQIELAEDPVRKCFLQESPSPCLIDLLKTFRRDTIMCVAKSLGEQASTKVFSGTATPTDSTIDKQVHDWIVSERLGYL